MKNISKSGKLIALPVQLVPADGGVVLVRGNLRFLVEGELALEAVHVVLSLASEGGATPEEISNYFAVPDRPAIESLVASLIKRKILLPIEDRSDMPPSSGESKEEVFYWHFDQTSNAAVKQINDCRIVIIGVNHISRRMVDALRSVGASNFVVVDYHSMRNLEFFGKSGLKNSLWPKKAGLLIDADDFDAAEEQHPANCIVATSDFGALPILREWNKYCIGKNIHYLPVWLSRMVGSVGPLVVPRATPCYECVWARENSHMENRNHLRAVDEAAAEIQSLAGYLAPMASILADVAAMELVKFYSRILPPKIGVLIEVNLLRPEIIPRAVLKAPRCPACSPIYTISSVDPSLRHLMPGDEYAGNVSPAVTKKNQGGS
jgi:molybdopterin-synthase adenylyltransferase